MSKTAHSYSSKDRTSDVLNEENVNINFASLLLSSEVLAGLSLAGFERPSPIQLKAIPLGRCGLDLIVQAKSGTGKTCVFSVIILESLDLQCPSVQALVLTPTREIATQVQGVIQAIGDAMQGLRCHTFIGGTLFGPDRQKLKKCHVAVGTPGRVKQLIEFDVMPTDSIRLFILDEADKLLDDKFQDQINWIYNHLPVNKQMLALSATYPEALARSLTSYMRDPTFVRLNRRNVALKGIRQFYKVVPGHSLYHKAFEIKVKLLLQLFTQVSFSQCLVFSNLSSRAQNLSDILCEHGWPSTCISGNQDQMQRLSAMSMLKAFQCRVLISTDLTARGIDAENVNLIVNLDVPSDGKTYLHRIGRAGRFGSKGVAVTLASQGNEETLLRSIQRQCRVKLQVLPDPVPSDLVNSVDVSQHSSDAGEESSSQPECDGSTQGEMPDYGGEVEGEEQRAKSAVGNQTSQTSQVLNDEEKVFSNSKTIGEVPYRSTRSDPGPSFRIQVDERGDAVSSVSHKTVTSVREKSCQVDTLSVPFNICNPVNFKIAPLADRMPPRRQADRWTWQKAAKDFEEFMSGRSELCDTSSSPCTEGRADELEVYNENPQVLEKSRILTEKESEIFISEGLDSLRISQVVGDLESSPSSPDHHINTQIQKELVQCHSEVEIISPEKFSSDCEVRYEPGDDNVKNDDSGKLTADNYEIKERDSLSQITQEEIQGNESAAEVSPRGDPIQDRETSIAPTMAASDEKGLDGGEADGDAKISRTMHGRNGEKLDKEGSTVESGERYKVAFAWRPSQNFFENYVPEDARGSLIAEGNSSESNDDTAAGNVTTDADVSTAGTGPNNSHCSITDDFTVKEEVDNKSAPLSVRPKDVTGGKKDKPNKAVKRRTAVAQYKELGISSSEKLKLQPSAKEKSPSANHFAHNHVGQFMLNKEVPATSNSLPERPQTNALIPDRQQSKKESPSGVDPIWQSYTKYLTTDDIQTDTDSRNEESESDSSDTSETSGSSSEQHSTVRGEWCSASETQNWKCPYESPARQCVNGWSPMPHDVPSSSAWHNGVPDSTPTPSVNFQHDHSSDFALDDYNQSLHCGQYAYIYWPQSYYSM